MDLPGLSAQLITALCAVNPNTAVVLQSGTPTTISPWLADCPALLQAWYGGNETGHAIADILFGAVNPSGKLPLTFPIRNEDNPAFLNYRSEAGQVMYGEGVFVGYRFYDKTKKEVAFPFGHGLSYTTFTFRNLQVTEQKAEPEQAHLPSEKALLTITLDLTNTGSLPGAQVAQIYIIPLPNPNPNPSVSVNRPPKELKGFTKVHLQAGETKQVSVVLEKKYAVSFWDARRGCWRAERGTYEVCVVGGCREGRGEGQGDGQGVRGVFFQVADTRWWSGL